MIYVELSGIQVTIYTERYLWRYQHRYWIPTCKWVQVKHRKHNFQWTTD